MPISAQEQWKRVNEVAAAFWQGQGKKTGKHISQNGSSRSTSIPSDVKKRRFPGLNPCAAIENNPFMPGNVSEESKPHFIRNARERRSVESLDLGYLTVKIATINQLDKIDRQARQKYMGKASSRNNILSYRLSKIRQLCEWVTDSTLPSSYKFQCLQLIDTYEPEL